MEKEFVKEIADINTDFSQWYTDVVKKAELADYGPAKGTIVFRPYGYAIWENLQHELDTRLKATGHVNAYFPMLIPMSLLTKESEHVEGFAPEVATITQVGKEVLDEPIVIRPTSETVICSMYSKWVQSYRDLPILINQWANVVRWEKTTRPFLRTREFLWQEGHTVHATESEALNEAIDILKLYEKFCKEILAIPVLTGRKTEKEKFAGAVTTFGMESMTLDGKSLQSGTTHYLGQNFSHAYDIKFLDKTGKLEYAYQTSWGVSTRLLGALIMAHGDQRGLVLPPMVAPVQVIVIPIAQHKESVTQTVEKLVALLKSKGIRAQADYSENSTGWKYNQWEMKGVSLRIEVGPRDIENGAMILTRRDTHDKVTATLFDVKAVKKLLSTIQKDMYVKAKKFMQAHIVKVHTMEQMKEQLDKGNMVKAIWCGCQECELMVKERLQATIRVITNEHLKGKCIFCTQVKEDAKEVIFARAY
ncbi:MAG: proline--tRNA ligase [Clostridia bacterium]|nr:proline--tRNA ligase [Clostridia bacterium]